MRSTSLAASAAAFCVAMALPSQSKQLRIMPMGDSITEAQNGHASYRYFLWHQLKSSGHCVDFVGSRHGVATGLPKYLNFDRTHAGVGGWTTDQLAANAFNISSFVRPDIVLLHTGSNDVFGGQPAAGIIGEIEFLIDELRRYNPKVTIFVAQVIPFDMAVYPGKDVGPLNALIPAMVAGKHTAASPVIMVDHNTGWDPAVLNYDGVHPTEPGEIEMADRWHTALLAHSIPVCDPDRFKIMPLGDSTTEGQQGYSSYRFTLEKRLASEGRGFDFVGSKNGIQKKNPKNWDFDQDHEGHNGALTSDLAAGAAAWALAEKPDMVLLHTGMNDVYQSKPLASMLTNIETIIDELRSSVPNVKIYLAQVIPFNTTLFPGKDVGPLNAALPGLAASKTTAASPVVIVDQFTGYDPATHSYDGVHPNDDGEEHMGENWFEAIRSAVPVSSVATIRMMPLGDSITEARKNQASYRYYLWKDLLDSGITADFVGSQTGVRTGNPKYPDFDQNHEGHWGLRADEIAAKAFDWAFAAKPDVAICHVGSNDMFQGQTAGSTVNDIEFMIDELRRANPRIKIYLAQIIPFGAAFSVDVSALNAALPAMVASKTSDFSPVILVDHNDGWDTELFSIDDVHPNESGEKRMAASWHRALLEDKDVRQTRPIIGDLKIMPFGDSITQADKNRASYRYFLWHQLQASGHCADFVGSLIGNRNGDAKYPDFDQDHDGHWTWRVDHMIPHAAGLVESARPDIILCHVGSVDLFDSQTAASTASEIETLIDEFRIGNPDVTILLAKVIPFGASWSIDVGPLNALIEGIAASKTTAQSPIVLVDHFTGWNPATHSYNGVHPNEAGETRMANTWHDAILGLGVACEARFGAFGFGCVGSAGRPVLDAAGGPVMGSPYSVSLSSMPAGAPVIGIIGFSDTTFNGNDLPMDLAPLGMPSCFVFVGQDFTQSLSANGSGTADWALPVPPLVPSLAGLQVYLQAAVGDAPVNALGVTVTNAAAIKLGVQ